MTSFDFQRYVDVRKSPGKKRTARGFGVYAYAGDVRVLNALSYAKPVRIAVEAAVRAFKAWYRSDLLGSAVKVGRGGSAHPRARRRVREGSVSPRRAYIAQNLAAINAATYGTEMDAFILINSATVDQLSGTNSSTLSATSADIQNSHVAYKRAERDEHGRPALERHRAAGAPRAQLLEPPRKLTCDRAGLMCCKDIDIATKTMVHLAHGSQKLADQVDLDDYLAQMEELKRAPVGSESGGSRTHLVKRVRALQLFAESDLYHRHTIATAGHRSSRSTARSTNSSRCLMTNENENESPSAR